MSLWIQRPIGQMAGLLLLLAMVSAGVPTGNVHAHADGDHDHDHLVQLTADDPSDQDDHPAPSDPAGDTLLHAHDVCTTVSALPMLPMLVMGFIVPMAPDVGVATSPPPSAGRIPPHRPPIV